MSNRPKPRSHHPLVIPDPRPTPRVLRESELFGPGLRSCLGIPRRGPDLICDRPAEFVTVFRSREDDEGILGAPYCYECLGGRVSRLKRRGVMAILAL